MYVCTYNKHTDSNKLYVQYLSVCPYRKYENRNLAQMDTVYPKAFVFRQEKNIPGIYDHKRYESYQLTVECNVREDGREEEGRGEQEKVNLVLDSSALLRRRKVFNKNLCEITRRHHKVRGLYMIMLRDICMHEPIFSSLHTHTHTPHTHSTFSPPSAHRWRYQTTRCSAGTLPSNWTQSQT